MSSDSTRDPSAPTLTEGGYADARIAAAPLPSRGTLRRRRNLLVQAYRFVRINLRILLVVAKGH